MKFENYSVKHTVKGDFIYCLKKSCFPTLCIFSPVMLFLISYFIESLYMSIGFIFLFSLCFSVLGTGVALSLCDIFFSKKKANIWFALSISKKRLLFNRIVCGCWALFITVIVSFAIPLLFKTDFFNPDYYNSTHEAITEYLIIISGTAILTLLSFLLTVFFSIKTSSIKASAVLPAITMILPTFILILLYSAFSGCINGTMYSIAGFDGPYYVFLTLSYILTPYGLPMFYETTDDLFLFGICVIANLIVAVTSIALSFAVLKKHKAETIGSGTKTQLTSTVTGFAVYVAVAMTAIKPFEYSTTYLLLLIAPPLAYFLIKLFMNIKKASPFKLAFKQSVPLIMLSVFLVLFCKTSAFGYLTAVPDIEDIEYACISPASSFHLNEAYESEPIKTYIRPYGYFESEKDLEFITELHRKTVKSLNKGNNCISIHYKLKNGKTLTRDYYYVSDEAAFESLRFTESDWFEKYLNACFNIHNTENDYVFRDYFYPDLLDTYLLLNNTLSKSVNLSDFLSAMDIYNLKEIVIDDLMALTAEEIFTPTEQPLFYLHFSSSEHKDTSPLPVYSSMKNTVKYLNEKNISVENTTLDEIESVQILKLEGDIRFFFEEYDSYETIDKTISAAFSEDYISLTEDKNIIRCDSYYYDDYELYYNDSANLIEDGVLPFATPINYMTYSDKETVEKYFGSFRANYCTIGDKGAVVNFRLKNGSSFIAYVPESEL